jgi:HlyD family type I secretion membrane fusion protein
MSDRYNLRWGGRFAFLTGFVALGLLVGVLGIWGTQARIAGAVIAPGLIKVESNRQIIQHADGGVVGAIYARNGDYVEAGQILLRLDGTDVRSELAIIEQQLLEATARIARLRAESDGETYFEVDLLGLEHLAVDDVISGQYRLFQARRTSFENELAQTQEQIIQTQEQVSGVEAQIVALDVQIELHDQEISTNERLDEQGLLIRSKLLEQQRSRARLQGERGRLVALRGQHLSAIAALELSKIRLDSIVREKAITELRDLETDRAELLEKQGIALRKLSRMEITAPVAGIVYGSQVFALQSVVEKAKAIMYIVPQDQALVVSVRVPASDVDQIVAGQDVSLRFTALDQRFTPEIFGVLNTISADSFIDEVTGKSYYEAEIAPLETELLKLGKQSLVPGMPVDAYIRTAERSPLSYLTKPLADYFYRAFREG